MHASKDSMWRKILKNLAFWVQPNMPRVSEAATAGLNWRAGKSYPKATSARDKFATVKIRQLFGREPDKVGSPAFSVPKNIILIF
jgi:hypothetical protein